jgi:hypothetical protein
MAVAGQNRTPSMKVRQQKFLAAYRNSCNIRASCEAAGIARSMFYRWRDEDPDFCEQLGYAGDEAIDSLEAAGWLRARKMSDSLMKFFLEANRPEKYRGVLKVDWRNIGTETLIALAGGGPSGVGPARDRLAEAASLESDESGELSE